MPARRALRTSTVIVGGGHAGLAMSRCLTDASIDHVILERGEVANSWKAERWDSMRLLTPNWQARLPGHAYDGDDPDGFMTVPQIVGFIEHYAEAIAAPIETGTEVTRVRAADRGYVVETGRGVWECRSIVLASGACNLASIPRIAADLPPSIAQISAIDYRHPGQLRDGGVLVVGASATGVQLAHEIQLSGRPVTLAVGEHVRMPRLYRGKDIQWWMDASGLLDTRYDEVDDLVRARNVPSPQLVGSDARITLDLNALVAIGVRLIGRLAGVGDGKLLFSGSLRNVCALADLKMNRLLNTLDEWARDSGRDGELPPGERFDRTAVPEEPPVTVDLDGSIQTILWATGFHPDYSWLDVPVLDRKGRIRHDGGVVASPGMYLIGANFLRRRRSSFIHGAAADAADLSRHLVGYLDDDAAARR